LILNTLRDLKLSYPKLGPERRKELEAARKLLQKEQSGGPSRPKIAVPRTCSSWLIGRDTCGGIRMEKGALDRLNAARSRSKEK